MMSFLTFQAIFFICFTFSCKQQSTEWKGTIEEKDGVVIVKNPKEPMNRSDVLDLEDELSIGGIGENQELIFAEVFAIAVDGDGKIFVCDREEGNIKKFNQNGELLSSLLFSKKLCGKRQI